MTPRSRPDRGRRVIVHTVEPRDGMAQYVAELVMALARAEVPVVLFCPANFLYEAAVCESGATVVRAAHRCVAPAGVAQRILRNIQFVVSSAAIQARLLRRGDIVHFQSALHLPLGFIFCFLVKLRGALIVLTAHDPIPHKWRLPQTMRRIEHRMLKWLYALCDMVIVHNESGKHVLTDIFHKHPERVLVIPHGPLSEGSLVDSSYPCFACLRLLFFGSIRENKGVHLAIQAVQMLNSTFGIHVRLTIAGCVDTANEEHFWTKCKRLIAQMPGCVEVIDRYIVEEEIRPLLARHHAVLLPYCNFYSESGVAALALSNQRPILATRAGGLGELLEQCSCGVPIESQTAEAIAQAIATAIQLGPERLLQMGKDGYRFVTGARNWQSIAQQTMQVYSRLSHGITAAGANEATSLGGSFVSDVSSVRAKPKEEASGVPGDMLI